MPARRSLWKTYAWVFATAVIVWVLIALWIAPNVIRDAYHGRSLAFINGLIEGQDTHAVAHYLRAWRVVALGMAAVLAALSLASAFLIWQRVRIGKVVAALSQYIPALRDRDILVVAVSFGLIAGVTEAVYVFVKYRVLHRAAGESIADDIFWMTPLAVTITLLSIAAVIIAVRRWTSVGEKANGVVLFAFASLCFYSIGRAVAAGIHPAALALLSAGLAAQVTRLFASRTQGFLRWARLGAVYGVAALGLWAAWSSFRDDRLSPGNPSSDRREARTGPNVLLLVWDTVRARSLSLYGYHRATTPNLDKFAQQAVVFDAAVTTAPWTLPAHASLFTGLYPHEHLADRDSPLDGKFLTLAEALSARGYRTAGFAANKYWVRRGFGLDRGFQWYEDRPGVSLEAVVQSWGISRDLRKRVTAALGSHRPALRASAEAIEQSFLKWVDQRDDRPFFAFLNLFDAHEPYLPPGRFGFKFSATTPRYFWDHLKATPFSPSELQQFRDAYDSCIYYLDYQLGQLLVEMKARGLLENTLLILTSDHGETLGEHRSNLLGHENNVYYDVLHVPLVVSLPSRFRGGLRQRSPVSLADVPATIMELVDPAGSSKPFPGQSLVPALVGEQGTSAEITRPLISQGNPASYHLTLPAWPMSKGPLFSLVEGDNHYIVNAEGNEELFNLKTDPWERRDLSRTAEADSVLSRYRSALRGVRVSRLGQ